jgi:hypothetical protein
MGFDVATKKKIPKKNPGQLDFWVLLSAFDL